MPDTQTPFEDLPILTELRDDLSRAYTARETPATTPRPRRDQRRRRSRLLNRLGASRRPVAFAGGAAAVAAAAAAALLLASPATQPAYALTPTSNGTYTLTINQVATAIPALNAKFQQLGIDMTVIPVTTTCTAPNDGVPLVGGWPASTLNQTITLDQANIPAGDQGVLAVYQSPSGGVDLDIGSVDGSGPLPACLNPNDVGYMKP